MKKPAPANHKGKYGMYETLKAKEIERLEEFPSAREVDLDTVIEQSGKPSDAQAQVADPRR